MPLSVVTICEEARSKDMGVEEHIALPGEISRESRTDQCSVLALENLSRSPMVRIIYDCN